MSDRKTVLVVDDDPDSRRTSKALLETAGYHVLTAVDSIEGEATIEAENPDVIVLDVMMEEVDAGFVLTEKLGDKYPIILLSSIANSSVKIFDIHEMPVKGILQKPVDPAQLLEAVNKAVAE
jgi:two-component system alkaline phosphatase synthesis response regulator PhoP